MDQIAIMQWHEMREEDERGHPQIRRYKNKPSHHNSKRSRQTNNSLSQDQTRAQTQSDGSARNLV
jgi:hypothetical protein